MKSLRLPVNAEHIKVLTNELETALARDFIRMVMRRPSSGSRSFSDPLASFTDGIGRAYIKVGDAEAAVLSRQLGKPIRFNPNDPYVVGLIAAATHRFVTDFIRDRHVVITQAKAELAKARKPTSIIGLTPLDDSYAANYRDTLERSSADALDRTLRDRRFDSTVEDAVDGEEPLTTEQIDTMVDAYRRRRIVYRAKRIAHVTTLAAVNEARQAALRQAARQAMYREDQIIRTWNAVGDARTRDSHFSLDGEEVQGFDEPFDADSGPILYPGDPSAPPEEIMNCRCWITFSMVGEKG
jgi:hypothetical protein